MDKLKLRFCKNAAVAVGEAPVKDCVFLDVSKVDKKQQKNNATQKEGKV